MSSIDQQFVEFIVKALVNKPEEVTVDREIDERGVLLSLSVAPEDVGRIIGKRGATAQSIRALLRVLGTKNGARYNLKIVNTDDYVPSSSSATASEPVKEDPEIETEDVEESDNDNSDNELAEKTRAELADLDDLDI